MVINVIGVKWFGQVEYALSTIKVLAIVAFIVIGLGILAFSANPTYGLHNFTDGGGFMPFGISGMWFATIVSIFSYLSIEMIAVAAGEAKNPVVAVKSAFKGPSCACLFSICCRLRSCWRLCRGVSPAPAKAPSWWR